ncbi:hypothetical protein TCON_0412 [Astathelohania contejeani]|uniref:Uncharacterized protein n=1 Tax=Astathelohania contejeani TaxID=164912 RepID=A0ABQ7I1Q5_9MICR|nr:hypothetical protein TCON_0412 [Thelohania contejeani]
MILFMIYLVVTKLIPTECSNSGDIYAINVRVHCESSVLTRLLEDINKIQIYKTHVDYFREIFGIINKKLRPYGVQLRADYAQLNLDDFPIDWDYNKNYQYSPVDYKTGVCKEFFKDTSPIGVGNRVVIFQFPEEQINTVSKASTLTIGECGNISGFLYQDPEDLKIQMIDGLLKMFSWGAYRMDMVNQDQFNTELCDYVRGCIRKPGNNIGEYIIGTTKVNDISNDNFMLPEKSKIITFEDAESESYY